MRELLSPKDVASPLGLYSHASVVGPHHRLVFVAGQVGVDKAGKLAGSDFAAQFEQAIDNVRRVLIAASASLDDVVQFRTYLVHSQDIPSFHETRERVFSAAFKEDRYPPNTLLMIDRLVREDLLVEVEAVAAVAAAE